MASRRVASRCIGAGSSILPDSIHNTTLLRLPSGSFPFLERVTPIEYVTRRLWYMHVMHLERPARTANRVCAYERHPSRSLISISIPSLFQDQARWERDAKGWRLPRDPQWRTSERCATVGINFSRDRPGSNLTLLCFRLAVCVIYNRVLLFLTICAWFVFCVWSRVLCSFLDNVKMFVCLYLFVWLIIVRLYLFIFRGVEFSLIVISVRLKFYCLL